jgi:hypothetical protein
VKDCLGRQLHSKKLQFQSLALWYASWYACWPCVCAGCCAAQQCILGCRPRRAQVVRLYVVRCRIDKGLAAWQGSFGVLSNRRMACDSGDFPYVCHCFHLAARAVAIWCPLSGPTGPALHNGRLCICACGIEGAPRGWVPPLTVQCVNCTPCVC